MSASTEVDKEIAQRAERRRQEIMEAFGESFVVKSFHSPVYRVNLSSASNKSMGKVDVARKSPREKENQSPKDGENNLLYPVQPPRSVYNSPLIKANRPALWKSPPPYFNSPNIFNHPQNGKMHINNIAVPMGSHVGQNSSSPVLGDRKLDNTPLSSRKGNKLYPSLPRTDLPVGGESVIEEKDMKDQSNYTTALTGKEKIQKASAQQSECGVQYSRETVIQKGSLQEPLPNNPCPKVSHQNLYLSVLKNKDGTADKAGESKCSNNSSENDIEDTYDMDRFLEEALGSVLDLDSPMADETARVVDSSPEESFHSVDSFRSLDKIHTTSTVRSSMRLVKHNLRTAERSDGLGCLLKEAEKQQQFIAQASKALNICRSSKAFSNTVSLVHAERLLLLATLRYQAVLDEVKGLLPPSEQNKEEFKGQLRILEVSAPLKENLLQSGRNELPINVWFLCVLKCGQQVLASDVVAYEFGAKLITFSGMMQLSNLPSSFLASLQIYSLRTRLPQESVRKSKMSKACNLLRRQSKSCLDSASGSRELLHLRTPAFALSGTINIDLSLATNSQQVKLSLEKVPLMSPLQGSLTAVMETSLISSIELSGFLTILEKGGESYAWQRRWCYLKELCLHFWNYPSDQDEKEPVQVIDLSWCCSEKIEQAPRHLCPRTRTLMLEATRSSAPNDMNSTLLTCNGALTVVRYFIACDSVMEMNEWATILNQVITSIRAWKVKKN